jgi:hypothetical protein
MSVLIAAVVLLWLSKPIDTSWEKDMSWEEEESE